ncbi:hypothetical protein BU23DRAFT_559668 [Bimuria novae-zelandiae CBS 107.79]|uniref:Uncharacterized protein n=1 Tax=Bimuria novae-zelandiae CBS 107.79 TaxID=1447943 RepID=A0A6A5UQA9_9PLEO|nr:hypothetical protein BU23DRAFT_559668 [Bimuria novae-zelandiae CBS 107.79]
MAPRYDAAGCMEPQSESTPSAPRAPQRTASRQFHVVVPEGVRCMRRKKPCSEECVEAYMASLLRIHLHGTANCLTV